MRQAARGLHPAAKYSASWSLCSIGPPPVCGMGWLWFDVVLGEGIAMEVLVTGAGGRTYVIDTFFLLNSVYNRIQ